MINPAPIVLDAASRRVETIASRGSVLSSDSQLRPKTGGVGSSVAMPEQPWWRRKLSDVDGYVGRRPSKSGWLNAWQFIYREEGYFAFLHWLLVEESIEYWFERAASPSGDNPGTRTLVPADHNDAVADNVRVRCHHSDATEARNSVQAWRGTRNLPGLRQQR